MGPRKAPTGPGLVLGAPGLEAALQVGCQEDRAERESPLPQHAGRAACDDFLGCQCTLPGHVQFFNPSCPQVLPGRAALSPLVGSVLVLEQDLALGDSRSWS